MNAWRREKKKEKKKEFIGKLNQMLTEHSFPVQRGSWANTHVSTRDSEKMEQAT